ncbi:hypothetical protein L208DRAFT_1305382, partial [Tricholoma matsutake]
LLVSGPEEMIDIHGRILEISDMLCFRRRVYSIIVMSFEGPEETRGLPICIPEISHILRVRGTRTRLFNSTNQPTKVIR